MAHTKKEKDLEKLKLKKKRDEAANTTFDAKQKSFHYAAITTEVFKSVIHVPLHQDWRRNILAAARCVGLDFSGAANEERICLMAVMLVQLNLAC